MFDPTEGPNLSCGAKPLDLIEREAQKMRAKHHTPPEGTGRHPEEDGGVRHAVAAVEDPFRPEVKGMMEDVVERENMMAAWKKVKSNNGAPGIDGMTVEELWLWLQDNWSLVKAALLAGQYEPEVVRGVEIPKPGGKGVRQLGIPTVLDRLIQQAVLQQLMPVFDPVFSEHSYGYRPGRSATQAAEAAQRYVQDGRRWVVDMDLEKFFDNVNHDILMSRVARRVEDKRVLRLIRRYLQAGMMKGGLVSPREEGTPQGGPLSPLLSNILLDEFDKELERRGHAFCRYADDCNIYLRSKRSGERVLASVTAFLSGHLRLKVNGEKSAVARPWKRTFLGFSMTAHRDVKLKPGPDNVRRFRRSLRDCFRRGRGRNLKTFIQQDLNAKLRGWANYFRISGVKQIFEDLDKWIRHRLRNIIWRQWKRPKTRRKKLIARGLDEERASKSAYNGRGPWWNSGANHMNQAFPVQHFDHLGLVSIHHIVGNF